MTSPRDEARAALANLLHQHRRPCEEPPVDIDFERADEVLALLDETEPKPVPGDEREALEQAISDALFEWDGDTRPTQRVAAYVVEAGFRRQGPITDATEWEYRTLNNGYDPQPHGRLNRGDVTPDEVLAILAADERDLTLERRRKAGPWERIEAAEDVQ